MRMRNPKDKDEILSSCNFYLDENLFNNDKPIHLELGMGKGDFILNMALLNPGINFIGVEKYSSVVSVAIKKIMNYEINNIRVLICDGGNLPEYLNGKIDLLYLNFSDPWPKDKHAKRRLTHENFLRKYDDLFKSKCVIKQKTDNTDLYEFSKESFINYGYKIISDITDLHSTNLPNVMSEYETKFSLKGQAIKYLYVEKEKE